MKLLQLKKWLNMLTGKSVLHIKKGEGRYWSLEELRGFYIDYSGKVNTDQIDSNGLPYTKLADGRKENIPITVIQYGLGCYEKILEGDSSYEVPMLRAARHMLETQHENGLWDAFKAQKSHDYYSSMIQGEGISLMLRAYILSGEEAYREAAIKAYFAMIKSVNEGGTAIVSQGKIQLLESTVRPMILNGAIYSMFGILDLWVYTKEETYKRVLDAVVAAIKEELPRFDTGYWSYYCTDGALTSPFYHQLHITQLELLAKLFPDEIFLSEATKYRRYYNSRICYARAFVKKAFQKVFEKSETVAIIE